MREYKEIQVIAEQLNAPEIYNQYKERLHRLDTGKIRIGIIGGNCTGKTTVLSNLIGINLPIQGYPSRVAFNVEFGETLLFKSSNYASSNTCPDIKMLSPEETISVYVPNTWIKHNNLILNEKPETYFEDGDINVNFHVSDYDICIYLLDGLMAFSKNDSRILDALVNLGIPTIVAISKLDVLQKNDDAFSSDSRKDVQSFVNQNLAGKNNVYLIEPKTGENLIEQTKQIRSYLDKILAEVSFDSVRAAESKLYLISAISALFSKGQEMLKLVEEREEQARFNTQNKKNKISALEGEWSRIELELTKKRQECESRIRTRLVQKKGDMYRRLSHELDTANDVKIFWERDLPYRLDEMMRAELQSTSQITNAEIASSLRWLQDELLKTFKRKSFIAPTISFVSDGDSVVFEHLDLADNKRLKIITRVGTAATVIAAGTLLASSGVAGVVMAISMVSGIGAEWFMGRKSRDSKDKVRSTLPAIIDQAILSNMDKISTSLKESYAEIIENLRNSQKTWKDEVKKEIEEEDAIAQFNAGREHYNKVMQQLDDLSDKVLD